MRRWIPAPLLASLLLLPLPGFAAKPTPPPPSPTIVTQIGNLIVASDGTVYEIATSGAGCDESIGSATVFGRFFTMPPVSPITSADNLDNGIRITLANGDVWLMYLSCCVACYKQGHYLGNVFTVAGTALGTIAPPADLAPVRTAPMDGANAQHGPRSVPTVPGAVE